jgi:RNA polymerase sigma factor (sigma-70 family)
MNDSLEEYVRTGAPEAFRRIVRAHTDAVYSQSLRQLRDPSLAEEVTQQVFVTLATKAKRISRNSVLAGWLFNTTRHRCGDVRRAEFRRRKHEQRAMQIRTEVAVGDSEENIQTDAEPLLNDAIAGLGGRDRDAILLRYFQGQSLREVGTAMGVSEDAAKQRVSRAVEKLRTWFAGQGLAVPSATVVTLLSSAVKPAPSHVLATVVATHLPKSASVIWSWMASKTAATLLLAGTVTIGTAAGVIAISDKGSTSAAVTLPSTAPVAVESQATPIDAMRKFSEALKRNDHKAIDECLTDDGSDPAMAALVRSHLYMDAAWCHVQRASAAAFKTGNVPFKSLSFNSFPFLGGGYNALIDRMLADRVPPEVTTEGDTAKIKVHLPRELLGGSGANRQRDLERWAGAMLVFKNVEGEWKLDTSRTINMVITNNIADKKADPMKVDVQLINMVADALEDGAQQIESGQLATLPDAATAVESSVYDAFKACHVNGMNFMDLPVVGG